MNPSISQISSSGDYLTTLLSSGQFLAFFIILAVGFIYLLGSFALTELGDLFGGGDTLGDAGGDPSHDTVSMFSPMVIAAFFVGFGSAGSIATYYEVGAVGSALIALLSGAALGGVGLLGMQTLTKQQSNSEVAPSSAVGLTGVVTLDIPPLGRGEVGVSVRGTYMTYEAVAYNEGLPVPAFTRGQRVKIVSAAGSLLVVQSLPPLQVV